MCRRVRRPSSLRHRHLTNTSFVKRISIAETLSLFSLSGNRLTFVPRKIAPRERSCKQNTSSSASLSPHKTVSHASRYSIRARFLSIDEYLEVRKCPQLNLRQSGTGEARCA